MAMRIWKLPVPIDDQLAIPMPHGAQLLTVQIQHGEPMIWIRCEDDPQIAGRIHRKLAWVGTGHDCTGCGAYVGTVQLEGGSLVFHLFDKGEI